MNDGKSIKCLTSNQSLSVLLAEVAHQVVKVAWQTRLASSLLLGIRVQACKRALKMPE